MIYEPLECDERWSFDVTYVDTSKILAGHEQTVAINQYVNANAI